MIHVRRIIRTHRPLLRRLTDALCAAYLRQLAPYRVLRFMDWQRTNSTLADAPRTFTCGNRTLPGSQSQGTTAGASVERMVELANVMHADPWFTIPHEADPGWIACHARIVAASLAPGLTPRYEFANETWNPVFRAFHDLTAEAVSAHLGGGDDYLGLQLRVGERHAAAMAVVGSEFASAGRGFVRVLAGQAANAWVLEQESRQRNLLAALSLAVSWNYSISHEPAPGRRSPGRPNR